MKKAYEVISRNNAKLEKYLALTTESLLDAMLRARANDRMMDKYDRSTIICRVDGAEVLRIRHTSSGWFDPEFDALEDAPDGTPASVPDCVLADLAVAHLDNFEVAGLERDTYLTIARMLVDHAVSKGFDFEAAVPGITEAAINATVVWTNIDRAEDGFKYLTREECLDDLVEPIPMSAFWTGIHLINPPLVDATVRAAIKYLGL